MQRTIEKHILIAVMLVFTLFSAGFLIRTLGTGSTLILSPIGVGTPLTEDASGNYNFTGGQAINMTFWSGTSFPATAVAGQPYYRTDLYLMYYYNGTQWVNVQQGPPGVAGATGFIKGLPFTYMVFTNTSGYYGLNGTTGVIDYSSATNASAVIDPLIITNATIQFRQGFYPINNLLKVDVSNVHFVGENWGTEFIFGASGGFNVTSTSALSDISFENIYFEGQSVASSAITSAMASGMRLQHFRLINNYFDDFDGATTSIAVNLTNLEVSETSHNIFYHCYTGIQLGSNGFSAGNNEHIDNIYYYCENAVRETALQRAATGAIGLLWSRDNQYFASSAGFYGFNLTTIQGQISGLHVIGDRFEGVAILTTQTANSTWNINGGEISNSKTEMAYADMIQIYLDQNTSGFVIHDNPEYAMTGSNNSFLVDKYTGNTAPNRFIDNYVIGTESFNASVRTVVFGNRWSKIPYVVKTAGIDDIRTGNSLCNWGAAAGSTSIVNSTIYTVYTNDVYISITGGTNVQFQLLDPSGTQFVQNATFNGQCVPLTWQINITWAAAPTINFLWTG